MIDHQIIFVCVTLIGVKSKYGSGWGTSPGLININDIKNGMTIIYDGKLYLIQSFQFENIEVSETYV